MRKYSILKDVVKNRLLVFALLFGLAFMLIGLMFPIALIAALDATNQIILSLFSHYYLWVGLIIVLVAIIIFFLPVAKRKLGNERAEYSYFSWIALLYSTGMGSGLLLRAVQEPIYYYQHPPVSGIQNSQLALQFTYFHWGFTPWAMYSLFGLIVAYNLYTKRADNILDAIVINKSSIVNKILPYFLVLITIAGVIASLGLGTGQFVGGLNQYFNWHLGSNYLLLVVFLIGLTGTLSALTGIKRVIKYLADFDMSFSIGLMVFVALFLSYSSFFSQSISAFFNYVIHFFEMSLSANDYKTSSGFTKDWTVFYWAFWLAWVPFTGIFIARISKGRSIREFIVATILVPVVATVLWFSVFANKSFEIVGNSGTQEFNNVFTSLFVFLQHLPLHQVTVVVAAVLVLVSIINSVDSAIFVLGILSDKGNENPAKKDKLLWGIIITATALGLTATGTDSLLNAVSNLLIILALPFSLLYLYIIVRFIYGFKKPIKL